MLDLLDILNEVKLCSRCKEHKSINEYYGNGKGRYCIPCARIKYTIWKKSNKKRCNELAVNWYRNKLWRQAYFGAMARAKKKKEVFNVTQKYIESIWTGRCSLTKIEFLPPVNKCSTPFSCSIDKINPKLPYTNSNIRFILYGVNALKGIGTDEDVITIAKALLKNQKEGDENARTHAL